MKNLALSITTVGRKNPVLNNFLAHDIERVEVGRISSRHYKKLRRFLESHPYSFGVHAPLPRPGNHHGLTHGRFHQKKRQKLLRLAQETYAEADRLGAGYIIFHLPLYNEESIANLLSRRGVREVQETIMADCQFLRQLMRPGGPPIYLEIMFLDHQAMTIDFLKNVLHTFNFGLCLDVGHFQGSMHRFPNRRLLDLINVFLPYVRTVHLYNTQGYKGHEHRPPHPSQKPEEDWIDLPRVLSVLRRSRPDCLYVLEYARKHAQDERYLEEGLDWIKQLLQ